MKKIVIFLSLLAFLFTFTPKENILATSVDTFRITYTNQSEKWAIIHKDIIYWITPQGIIMAYDTKTKIEYPFFKNEQPLTNLYSIVAYDGRYLVYNRYDDISYNVSVYDTLTKKNINITDGIGSRWATDFDDKVVVYIDGGACGKLYAYNILTEEKKLITEQVCGNANISKNVIAWSGPASGGFGIWTYNLKQERQYEVVTGSGYSSSPDIYDNNVIWTIGTVDGTEVHIKNMNTLRERIIYKTSDYNISWPSISGEYAVWGKNTAQHVSGVEGIDLKTGEVFEIQEQGQHQNGNMSPIISDNIVTWMAWRTGNGDIYGAVIGH